MSYRKRHPHSLPPPPTSPPHNTPPTSPEQHSHGLQYPQWSVRPSTSASSLKSKDVTGPGKRVLKRKKSRMGLREKENLMTMAGGFEKQELSQSSSGGGFMKRLRSVKSVPLLNSTKSNRNSYQQAQNNARPTATEKGTEEVLTCDLASQAPRRSHKSTQSERSLPDLYHLDQKQGRLQQTDEVGSPSSTNLSFASSNKGLEDNNTIESLFAPSSAGYTSTSTGHRRNSSASAMSSIGHGTMTTIFATPSGGSSFGMTATTTGTSHSFNSTEKRERTNTIATTMSGSGSPRSTIKIHLGEETPRPWVRRNSDYSEGTGSMTFGRTPTTLVQIETPKLPNSDGFSPDVYRRSRDLQRIMDDSPDLVERLNESDERLANPLSDESLEEIRESEEVRARFLKRHSRDFGHLYQGGISGATPQPAETVAVPSTPKARASIGPFNPDEDQEQRQQRIIEEAKKEGREKRRSWMLSRAGLIPGPQPATPQNFNHKRNSSSVSTAFGGLASPSWSPRTEEMTPRGKLRPLSLVLNQQMTRNDKDRRRSLNLGNVHEMIVLGPPLVASATPVIQEDDEDSDRLTEMTRSPSSSTHMTLTQDELSPDARRIGLGRGMPTSFGHRRGTISGSRGSSLGSSTGSASLSRSASLQQATLPLHLRSFSGSSLSMANSSMSSLGAIIGGTANSESSCSSGGEHLGGPRVLSPEAFNFRMSVAEREKLRADAQIMNANRPESRMTNSTFAFGSIRTESRLTMRGPTPDLGITSEDLHGPDEDREARIRRRRARAFLVAGLKLEKSSMKAADAVLVAEQEESPLASTGAFKKDRRGGIMVEENLGIGEDPMEVITSEPTNRKRYSVMRREKSTAPLNDVNGETSPVLTRAGTPLLSGYLRPGASSKRTSATFLSAKSSFATEIYAADVQPTITDSPAITISVIEDGGISRAVDLDEQQGIQVKSLPRDESDKSLRDSGAWRAESGEVMRELFWLPGSGPGQDEVLVAEGSGVRKAEGSGVRKVKSDIGLHSAFRKDVPGLPRRSMLRPASPTLIHADSAGASPGREKKATWSDAARGWLRSETKPVAKVDAEQGFGLGRGGETTNTLQSNHPISEFVDLSTRSQPSMEKKSWMNFLGGGRKRRRGSLPEALLPTTLSAHIPVGLQQEQDHARRSTEPFSQVSSAESRQLLQTPSPTMLSPPYFPTLMNRMQASHFSPLSAASFSPQTPEYLSMSPGSRADYPSPMRDAQGMGIDDILLPTPGISHKYSQEEHLRSSSVPRDLSFVFPRVMNGRISNNFDPSPSRMDMSGRLYGLGLEPAETPQPPSIWKGKARAQTQDEEATWQRGLSEQALALVRLAKHEEADSDSVKNFTFPILPIKGVLGHRPTLGIHAATAPGRVHSIEKVLTQETIPRAVSPPNLSVLPSPVQTSALHGRPSVPVHADSTESAVIGSTSQFGASTQQSVLLRHDTQVVPAKLFFLLGFLLGPWVWLLGGWALSPAGHFLSSTHLPLGNHSRSRFETPVSKDYRTKGIRGVFPPLSRDRPEKWVKRNRLAAVVSSAVFIPGMCVGFGYLAHLL